jgi:hypothetical protein
VKSKVKGIIGEKKFGLTNALCPCALQMVIRKPKPETLSPIEDTEIPVVPIKELIRMKEKSNRPQVQADVFYFKKIMDEWKNEE